MQRRARVSGFAGYNRIQDVSVVELLTATSTRQDRTVQDTHSALSMNRGIGLVAYGDSDSSDDETSMAVPSSTSTVESGTSKGSTAQQRSNTVAEKDLDRPLPQDTISARSLLSTTSTGSDSLNKIASANLMRQGLASKDQSETNSSGAAEGSFIRSGSGTPLPADHSAAAEIMNTPTEGRSPHVIPTERMSGVEGVQDQSDNRVNQRVSPGDLGNDRGALMRSLLKPKPIPGVDNFGIPAEPKGEINPAVQAKIEQFHHVKLTRGIHFNQSLMKNKNFRNPHIYTSLVEFVQLNETGSNFEQVEFFDFGGYGPESYATGIAEAQKQASERLAQQQAMARSQLQFVPGSTVQPGVPIVTANGAGGEVQGGITSRPLAPASLPLSGAPVTSGTQRGRKSKWDVSQPVDDPASKRSRH